MSINSSPKLQHIAPSVGEYTANRTKFFNLPAPEGVHPLVKRLFEEARARRISDAELARLSGVHRDTIGGWRRNCNPSIQNLDACVSALGLEMVIGRAAK